MPFLSATLGVRRRQPEPNASWGTPRSPLDGIAENVTVAKLEKGSTVYSQLESFTPASLDVKQNRLCANYFVCSFNGRQNRNLEQARSAPGLNTQSEVQLVIPPVGIPAQRACFPDFQLN